jgi:type II secretory pathway pseudopilin PulG
MQENSQAVGVWARGDLKKRLERERQRGATLLELLMYLGLAAIVVVGAIVLYQQSSSGTKLNASVRSVVSLQSATRALYEGSAGFGTGDLGSSLIRAGGVPADLLVDSDDDGEADAIFNEWDGEVTLTGNGSSFYLSYDEVPDEACIRLVTTASQDSGTTGVGILAIDVAAAGGTPGTGAPPPISPADADGLCDNDDNLITWELSK